MNLAQVSTGKITLAEFFFRSDPPATNELLLFVPVASTIESTNLVIFFATPQGAVFWGYGYIVVSLHSQQDIAKVFHEYDTYVEIEDVYHLLDVQINHERSRIFRVFNVHNGNSPLL